ncbi:unnamed protein product [Ceutorhynchus assimilis]|uniref:Vesicle transport protein USE1 n=1 Tax=Ceutorhynchus assimilis TaxID=467358 RepID=A0A9N9QP85_9CUCU|nr:unnamed protein product [Ceutorhynchus assimilis]
MVGLPRQEINLRRLLTKCELMCKTQKDDERLEKYVNTLEEMVQDIKKNAETSIDSLKNYQKRIMGIKTVLGITSISKYDEFNNPIATREALFEMRQRNVSKPGIDSTDLDQVLKYQEDIQTRIAEEMLDFTKTLKEQSEIANKIIKQDTEVLTNSTNITDKNFAKLATESTKLEEHSKRAWKCWMWVMLLIVLVVFMNMVLFMKVMKKSK